jgi:exonuclease SbcC
VQLRRLKLVNFRQHADTEFDLGPGLTAVIGPNGVGKTTLLEALAWSIYGNPAARGNKDSIRWNRAPARSPVRVELDFTLGAHEYRIARGLHDAQLFQDRGSDPISSGTAEVTAVLTRILGMTREEFFNTYFTGQKELAVMAALKPAERGRFLSQVLGYEKLKSAQDAVRQVRGQLKGELAGLESGLGVQSELERERTQAEERRVAATKAVEQSIEAKEKAGKALEIEGPEWTRMVDIRQKASSLESDRRAAEHQVVDAKREHERLDRDLAEALTARTRLGDLTPKLAEVEPLRSELERLEAEGRAAGQRRDLSGQLKEVESQLNRAATRLLEMRDVATGAAAREKELLEARHKLKELETLEARARGDWVQEREHARTKRDELREQYRDIKEQRDKVVELGPKGLCPTCGRPLGKDFEKLVETFGEQLEKLETNGQYFRSRMAQLEAEPQEVTEAGRARAADAAAVQLLTQAVADAKAAIRERTELERGKKTLEQRIADLRNQIAALPEKYDEQRHDQVRDRLKELEPLIKQRERYAVQAERAAALVTDMESAEKRLSERENRAEQLTQAIADLGFSEEKYKLVRERHERAVKAVQDAELDLVALRGDLKAAENALAHAVRRVEERAKLATRITGLQSDVRLHDELDTSFGEIRTDLNAQMRPELSDIASSLLAELTDGRFTELELDEGYGIVLLEDGVSRPVPSGGEEDVANLALRIAISQLVADRAGQPLSLLVLDEIFGSLDESRREHVVSLLRGLADRFPQVILITHIESVRDRVDRVLRVRLDETRGAAVVTSDGDPLLQQTD